MANNAPGKHYRKGIGIMDIVRMFDTEQKAYDWLASYVWPEGPVCPYCGSCNVQSGIRHPQMTHRCRDFPKKKMFTLKTGTIMSRSKLDYRTWAIAAYLIVTNLKGISSMKLHRELNITQKSAWHLLYRLRKAYETGCFNFQGPVEVDEAYFGGKEGNKHASKKLNAGRGTVGKTAVVGIKDRDTNQIKAKVASDTTAEALQGFVLENTGDGTTVYTDDHTSYTGLPKHDTVKHSVGEYVKGQAHINGVESFWATLKRGYYGVYHQMSKEHLHRYVSEFARRHNARELDTEKQMGKLITNGRNRRLRYQDLIAHAGS